MENSLFFSIHYHARKGASSKNKTAFILLLVVILSLILLAFKFPDSFRYYFIISCSLIFLSNFIFKISLFAIFFYRKLERNFIDSSSSMTMDELPFYTILLPVYKEKHSTLIQLIDAIASLEYPKDKLEVLILIEIEDEFTKANLPLIIPPFKTLIIPKSCPKTKPKACNYGLYFAKGEFIVVYDAEDIPDTLQLKHALIKFKQSENNTICVQSMLNFYNKNHNSISRFFTLEYLMWFKYLLPSISSLGLFIPLGGTSNHFRRKELIQIGGWDAYNVTEDAELGVRIYKNNFKTVLINSFTMEESPFGLENWILQRTRWMKGYLQTFLTHVLDVKGNKKTETSQFLNLFFSIGLSFFSFFLIPFSMLAAYFTPISPLLLFLYILNLFSGLTYIFLFRLIEKREAKFLGKGFGGSYIFISLYFFLHIIASFIAFFEFFIHPFYWHKTEHNVK